MSKQNKTRTQNPSKSRKPNMRGRQGRKDSDVKRVNLDNARVDKVRGDIERGMDRSDANDISDFTRNPELLKAAASIPIAEIVGTQIGKFQAAVPGIMVYSWIPTLSSDEDGIVMNKAFQQIYSYITHANSRNYKYEYTDLGMYMLAGIDVFTAIAELIRAYGVAKYYQEQSIYTPDAVLLALGFNGNDMRNNLSNAWFDINNLITQTKQIWVPNIMPLITRWISKGSYIYTDATGPRAQLYCYRRAQWLKLEEKASKQGTCLRPLAAATEMVINIDGSEDHYLWKNHVAQVQEMIDALILSQDRGMIYGDILKAYGAEKIFAMGPVAVDYTVVPQFNAEILMQMENITTCKQIYSDYVTNGVTYAQTTDDITNRMVMSYDYAARKANTAIYINGTAEQYPSITPQQILNFHIADNITPEMIVIATRGKVGSNVLNKEATLAKWEKQASGQWQLTLSKEQAFLPVTVPSEAVVSVRMITTEYSSSAGTVKTSQFLVKEIDDQVEANTAQRPTTVNTSFNKNVGKQMAFDWHPFIYQVNSYIKSNPGDSFSGFVNGSDVWGDFDNYTVIDDNTLLKINETCLYSVLGVPQLG